METNKISRDAVIKMCIDMANRYDEDIEGCDGDELIRYSEGISCCFRLAYIFKYGKFPPSTGEAWQMEFTELSKALYKTDPQGLQLLKSLA